MNVTQSNTPVPTCKRGHPRTPENTRHRSDGARQCLLCKRERQAKWHAANRSQVREQRARYYRANQDHARGREAKRNARLRQQALDAYGRECACCGETTERFLTIDHVNDDGAAHRREIGRGGSRFYRWLGREDYPDGFQTLCINCNHGKHANGGKCPHAAPTAEPKTRGQKYRRRLKAQAVEAYGDACSCCGEDELTFLCIDHASNNGATHRRETGITTGTHTYRWLRDQGWPGGFQVLCFNCNDGRHLNGGVCPHEELAG